MAQEATRQRDYIEDLRSTNARIVTEKDNAVASWTNAQNLARRTLAEKAKEQAATEEREKAATADHVKELRDLRGQVKHHKDAALRVETVARETMAR